MSDETTAAETTAEVESTQTVQTTVDESRIARQARFNAQNEEADALYWKHYAANGGKRIAEIEKNQTALQERLNQVDREKAIERALRVHNLSEDDVDLLTGATPKEIEAQAAKLRARLDREKPTAEAETETATKTQPELVQYQQQAQLTPQEQRAKALRDAVTAGVKAGTWKN